MGPIIAVATVDINSTLTKALVFGFILLVFCCCLALTVYAWKQRKKYNKRPYSTATGKISWNDKRVLRYYSHLPDHEKFASPSVRAMKARLYQQGGGMMTIFVICATLITIVAFWFVLIVAGGIVFTDSPLFLIAYILFAGAPFILFPLLLLLLACSIIWIIKGRGMYVELDYAPIIIRNNLGNPIKTYLNLTPLAVLSPGKSVKNKALPATYDNYFVKAEDENGTSLFDKEYDMDSLDECNWTVTIGELAQ